MSEQTKDHLQGTDERAGFSEEQNLHENIEATTNNKIAEGRILDEIHQENAEDAEDLENSKRHEIPFRNSFQILSAFFFGTLPICFQSS